MATKVAGEQYETITGQLFEIGRQLRQSNGYPFDPGQLKVALQNAIEGKFSEQKPARKPKVVKQPSLLAVVEVTQTSVGPVSMLAPVRAARFVEWAASVLGMPSDTPIKTLSELLIDRGHVLTNEQAIDIAKRTGLKIDDYANYHFKVNCRGSVSVGSVYRTGGRLCSSYDFSLDDSRDRSIGSRLLVRQLRPDFG